MHLRRLEPADAGDYRALMIEAYRAYPEAFTSSVEEREHLPLAWWEARIGLGDRPVSRAFGVFQDSRLMGAAALELETRVKARHKARLIGMYVRPEARGRGAGRALVEAILAEARACGVRLVQLTVTDGNAAAQALYASCGFRPYGLEPLAVAVEGGFVDKALLWREL